MHYLIFHLSFNLWYNITFREQCDFCIKKQRGKSQKQIVPSAQLTLFMLEKESASFYQYLCQHSQNLKRVKLLLDKSFLSSSLNRVSIWEHKNQFKLLDWGNTYGVVLLLREGQYLLQELYQPSCSGTVISLLFASLCTVMTLSCINMWVSVPAESKSEDNQQKTT